MLKGALRRVYRLFIPDPDALWGDRRGRRHIRLGKWMHANEVPSEEDILSNPDSIPYTEDLHEVLAPSIPLLKTLMASSNSDLLKDWEIPAKRWLENEGANTYEGKRKMVPYVGDLNVQQRAKLHNWFHIHIGGSKPANCLKWMGRVPLAHAITILLASRPEEELLVKVPKIDDDEEGAEEEADDQGKEASRSLMERAWSFQTSLHTATRPPQDPDLE